MSPMNCEEFEAIGLGLQRPIAGPSESDAAVRAAALEHAQACPRCAALQEAWVRAQAELQLLRLVTQDAQAPPRVEMRVLQEFRHRHHTVKTKAAAVFAAWALAAIAVLAVAVSSWSWRAARNSSTVTVKTGPPRNTPSASATEEPTLIADNDGDFTLLPGSLPQETDDAAIVRVRLQRGALGALGLPVNQERAGEWLQVDFLVGEDGQPRAVRLPSETSR
jgi:hypothetical protein